MKTLSLCMITKNEEKNLSRCLDSIKDIVDEIIIVDTGSTDKTVEIAKSYGAHIYHYDWNNDFSKARNVSLQKATKDWILVLDADEVLPYEEGLKLKNIITFDLERLIILEFEGFDDLDDIISKKLVIELMGKHSNIILLDDSNIIIDSLRHIKEIDENFRDILPHTKYYFPTSDKLNFLELKDFEDFKQHLIASSKDSILVDELPSKIANTFNGISKSFINAIIKKLNIIFNLM